MPSPLTLRAPAKLNLYLHITGKRADGYHTLESLVVFTDLADTLSIEAADSLSLTCDGAFADASGAVEDNLVLRAAQALQAAAGCAHGATLTLTKNIPVGAGLGGGSSDAAATLNGLNRLWQLGMNADALHRIAVALGADVAMCLDPKPALVRGIGDTIEPLATPLPRMAALLLYPRIPLLTKEVYAAFRESNDVVFSPREHDGFWESLSRTRNDLQPAAITLAPQIAALLERLAATSPSPRLVRMTGSGACCFALYDSIEAAKQAEQHLKATGTDAWIKAVGIS